MATTIEEKTTYEAMFLLDNREVVKGFAPTRDWVKALLEKHGATVRTLRLWGERELAYSIGRHKRATYLLGYFEASGETVAKVKHDAYLVGPVIRMQVLSVDEVPEEELARGIEDANEDELRASVEAGARAEEAERAAAESAATAMAAKRGDDLPQEEGDDAEASEKSEDKAESAEAAGAEKADAAEASSSTEETKENEEESA